MQEFCFKESYLRGVYESTRKVIYEKKGDYLVSFHKN